MKRDIYKKLLEWKSSPRRKPLLLRGARQVGKTYILQEFGGKAYDSIAYFNFEEDPAIDDFFQEKLDPKRIISNLSLYLNLEIKPGKCLIIFDEIQASNNALNGLKYFSEQAQEYHIAAAGSLVGITLSRPRSFPVGKINFLDMYPLTFPEFLDATGRSGLRQLIETKIEFSPFPQPFHNELLDLLGSYFFVGGMPEPVKVFVETGNLGEVRKIQKDIINAYLLDFSKHAITSDISKLNIIWDSIPAHLSKENKKFVFTAIRKSARGREYESALQWLENAGLIYKSYQVTTAKNPLKRYMNRNNFKVFVLDVGILGAMVNLSPQLLAGKDNLLNEFKGAFVENYVAQQLRSEKKVDLYYWTSKGKKAETDFLCEFASQVYPLEAKAGINPKSKSLISFDRQFHPNILSRTTLLNLRHDGRICNYPLYAITLFPELFGKK
ncbi:MAG: ATP-binding protein [Thermodesulfobacteriota bacterium]|nr:ATP-binding protein [Thermodesulfobacteriota bacterium]